MTGPLSQQKENLRASIKERIQNMPENIRDAESRSICRRLKPLLQGKKVVAGFFPMPTEPDIRPLLQELMDEGTKVFLPCFTPSGLGFRELTDMKSVKMSEQKFMEPPMDAATLDASQLEIVLVPGRAFDRNNNRLGRGNGGYDKWIETHKKDYPNTTLIGVGFECQLVHEIPMEEHDQKMDQVVTARG